MLGLVKAESWRMVVIGGLAKLGLRVVSRKYLCEIGRYERDIIRGVTVLVI
jgi:hypothetical protein